MKKTTAIRQFAHQVDDLRHAIKIKYNNILADAYGSSGLTHLQSVAVVYVTKRERVTVTELGKRLGIAKSNVSTLSKRLESEGYFIRQRSSTDQRTVYLMPTQKAVIFNRQREEKLIHSYSCYLNDRALPQEDMEEILTGLKKLDNMLTIICEKEGITIP